MRPHTQGAGKDDMHRWWNEKTAIDTVVQMAGALNDDHPDARLVAVGQSLAWVVYAAGKLREAAGQPDNTEYIAFTGSFMRRGQDGKDGPTFRMDRPNYPDEGRLNDYFDYLAGTGVSPVRTAALFNTAAKPSIYVDFVVEGLGFATFMHMFLKSAGGEVPQGAQFHAFQPPYVENAIPKAYTIETATDNFVRVPLCVTENPDVNILSYVAGLTGESDVTEISDRLVPTFDISKYGSGVLRASPNERNVADIKTAIQAGIARKLSVATP